MILSPYHLNGDRRKRDAMIHAGAASDRILVNIILNMQLEIQMEPEFTKPLYGETFFHEDGAVDELLTFGMYKD